MKDDAELLLLKVFRPLLNHIDINSGKYNFRYLSDIKTDITEQFEKGFSQAFENKDIRESLLKLLKSINIAEILDELKKANLRKINELKTSDYRIELFYNLLERADKIAPHISIFIITRINVHNYIEKIIEPYDLFEEAEKSHGEHKARITMRLFPVICGFLYENYIRMLWELNSVLEGKTEIRSKGKFGKLINDLVPRLENLDMLELIEPKAAFYRNAASHASYTYDSKNNLLELWDVNKAKTSFDVESLYETASEMYSLTSFDLYNLCLTKYLELLLTEDLVYYLHQNWDKIIDNDPLVLKGFDDFFAKKFEPLANKYKFHR